METNETGTTGWRLRPTEDGIQISDSILWLDARFTGDLSFLSSAHCLTGRTEARVITTEETVRLLGINHIKLNALVCPYNQVIALGQLKMELLPSGAALGGASLYVETRQGTLLYAPQLQAHKTGITRTMQLKSADTLILGARTPYPAQHHPSRKKEKDRLLQAVQAYIARGDYPVILCEPFAVAQELCKLFAGADIPLAVSKSIYRINKVYEQYGSELGGYSLLHRKLREKKLVLLPLEKPSVRANSGRPLPEGPLFCVEESVVQNTHPDLMRPVNERFIISSSCDGRDLKSIIQTVEPREVYFTGPYAKQYELELASSKIPVQALFPSHLPVLF
jgi:hypothetical protein